MTSMTAPLILSPSSILRLKSCLCGEVGLLLYNWYVDLSFEFKYIWCNPPSSFVKWNYVWSRYVGILLQLVYCIFSISILSFESVPIAWCRGFHGVIAIVWEISLLCLGVTLRQQTIPLYKDRPKFATILNIFACVESITHTPWTYSITQRVELGGACIIKNMTHDTVYFSLTRLMFHGTFWAAACMSFEGNQPIAWRSVIQKISPGSSVVFVLFMSLLTGSRITAFSDTRKFEWTLFFHYFVGAAMVSVGLINCRLIKKAEYARVPIGDDDGFEIDLDNLGP